MSSLIGRRRIDPRSLLVQMILVIIFLGMFTSVAAGIPTFVMLDRHFDKDAWAHISQGQRATEALYAARQSRLIDLATLTAQRPTMMQLLVQNELEALTDYLLDLQQGARLSLVQVCDPEGIHMASAGEVAATALCVEDRTAGFNVLDSENGLLILHYATSQIGDAGSGLGKVVVAVDLGRQFSIEIRDRTGLEHTILLHDRPVATSLDIDLSEIESAPRTPVPELAEEGITATEFQVENRTFMSSRIPLSEEGLVSELAMDMTDIRSTKNSLALALGAGILGAMAIGSIIGLIVTRRVTKPLGRLSQAARAFSTGDLETPVAVEQRVLEVTAAAQALEGARRDLKRTLGQLMQQKIWRDQLLEAIMEGIVTLDEERRITFFSPGAERITGWGREEVLLKSCDLFFQPLETEEAFSELIPSPGARRTISVRLAEDHQATLAVTGARLVPEDSEDAETVFVFRDVSEQEAIHRLLGFFLANVSHEFRTPLSALAASIELLLDQTPSLSPSEMRELLNSLHLGILGLETLVDNLLEGASIESGHFRVYPHPADVGKILGEAVETVQPLLDKRHQRMKIDLPATIPVVLADPKRTVQVMVNLLSNACKYGPDGTDIAVKVTQRPGWIRVAVADNGPGIPSEHKGKVFRRFWRLESSSDRSEFGAGLGLSVVKAVVEGQGGEVGLEDGAGGGSVFWFTLPEVVEQ